MKVHGFDITPGLAPLGIKYWAEVYTDGTRPWFEVFNCLGMDEKNNFFAFENRKKPSDILFKKYEELMTKEFKPFLYNFDRIEAEMEKVEQRKHRSKK